jgi:hypothetical protein
MYNYEEDNITASRIIETCDEKNEKKKEMTENLFMMKQNENKKIHQR